MNGQPEPTDSSEQMRQESASASGSASAETGVRKQCVACRELILPSAKTCPHCRSSQATRWAEVGAALKWTGGIAAVVSLLLSTWQLHDLVRASREKAAAVAELVGAADIRQGIGQYGDALAFIDEALKLEPGSRYARDRQVTIAMGLVRDLYSANDHNEKLLQSTTAILYRGAAQADQQRAADALAHLGWVHHLFDVSGKTAGRIPEDFFNKAIERDPHNPFAHTFWADRCRGYGTGRTGGIGGKECMSAEDASAHYTEALTSGREKKYVYGRMLGFFCTNELEVLFRHCAKFFQDMKKDSYVPTARQRKMVYGGIYDVFLSETAFTTLLAQNNGENIVYAIKWIGETEPGQAPSEDVYLEHRDEAEMAPDDAIPYYLRKMWSPRLKELAGDTQAALKEYKVLRLQARKWRGHHDIYRLEIFPAIDEAVARLIGFQRGWLGVKLEELSQEQRKWLGSPEAARVLAVDPGSPAEKAGILPGDILLSVDGEDWDSMKGKFIVGTAPGGKAIELGVSRGEERLKIYVRLGAVPVGGSAWSDWLVPVMIDHELYGPGTWPLPEYGVTLAELTDELRKGYNIPDDVRGVLILNNSRGRESFSAGDVVSEIEQRPVARPDELIHALQTGRTADKSVLQVTRVRNGARTSETWNLNPTYWYDSDSRLERA